LVIAERVPLRRSPCTTSTVKVSLTFRLAELGPVRGTRLGQRDRDVDAPIGSLMLFSLS